MPQNKIPILSTRPLPNELIAEAEQKGFKIDITSFIKIEKVDSADQRKRLDELSQLPMTVIFTSMNAVETVIDRLGGVRPAWKIYCVGNTTGRVLSTYFGDNSLAGCASNASALAGLIVDDSQASELVFFCGDQRRDELPAILYEHKIAVEEMVVYKTIPVHHIVRESYSGILFFSPSAVKSFFETNNTGRETIFFAVGETTAAEIRTFTSNQVLVSAEPGSENLVTAMFEFYQLQSGHTAGRN